MAHGEFRDKNVLVLARRELVRTVRFLFFTGEEASGPRCLALS